MLPRVEPSKRTIAEYEPIAPTELIAEIKKLAAPLRGLRVIHLNATPKGGGVAEMLQTLVSLQNDVGLKAEWYVIPPNPDFFVVTKKIHNTFQGKKHSLTNQEKQLYIEHNKKIAELMDDIRADVWVVHDPQPMAAIEYLRTRPAMVSRIHIDTSTPHGPTLSFLERYMKQYDRVVFSLPEFVPKDFDLKRVVIFNPAIDPLSPKNKALPPRAADTILEGFGINILNPLAVQVSRFDPWKDPMGVIDAYYLAKNKIPDLQLMLVGLALAQDDPEADKIFKKVQKHAKGDPDIFLFSDIAQIGPMSNDLFVNAVQVGADVVIQKSTREGFGLVVTEAMWKGRPVIGGNVGGIRVQIENGKSGFLVNSSKEAAHYMVALLKDRVMRRKMGRAARERVRKHFLLPRLLRDYLKMLTELKG